MARWILMTALLLIFLQDTNPPQKTLEQLEGIWSFTEVRVNGESQPRTSFEAQRVINSRHGRYVVVQGDHITRGTFKLDTAQSPMHYDIEVVSGSATGMKAAGIFSLGKDSYKTCLPLRNKERPNSLESQSGDGNIVHVYKREEGSLQEALNAAGCKELAGTWQATTYALDGKKASDSDLKMIRLVIDSAGKATALNNGKVFIESVITVDPAFEPMTIDLTYSQGEPSGKIARGIYKIEKDVLTICRSAVEKERPSDFVSEPLSNLTLMTYTKVPGTSP